MALGARFETAAAATVNGYTTILFTSNTVTASATPTIADGSYATTAEASVLFTTLFNEIKALEADVADIRDKFNKGP